MSATSCRSIAFFAARSFFDADTVLYRGNRVNRSNDHISTGFILVTVYCSLRSLMIASRSLALLA
jgi:hypothetical protein